jgi:hypothetical protein
MIEEQHIKPMLKFLKDLEKVFEKHSGGMTYTNRDDGIHATIGSAYPVRAGDKRNSVQICIGFPDNGECLELKKRIEYLTQRLDEK